MMIGRSNFSAEKMTLGTPHAAAPLAVQQELPPLAMPVLSLNGTPLPLCTFADGLDGWQPRPGLTARLLREQQADPAHGAKSCLKVINMYPAGDFSVTAAATPCDLAATPWLHVDYCFDAGAQINLYVRKDDTWYEFLLTGKEAQQPEIISTARLSGYADGNWHHLAVNLAAPLQAALNDLTGKAPADLRVQEIVFADWSASSTLHFYGFNSNPGGMVARYANFVLMPALKGNATISWTAGAGEQRWKVGVDALPSGKPLTETTTSTFETRVEPGLRFFHLETKGTDGQSTVLIHLPLQGEK